MPKKKKNYDDLEFADDVDYWLNSDLNVYETEQEDSVEITKPEKDVYFCLAMVYEKFVDRNDTGLLTKLNMNKFTNFILDNITETKSPKVNKRALYIDKEGWTIV